MHHFAFCILFQNNLVSELLAEGHPMSIMAEGGFEHGSLKPLQSAGLPLTLYSTNDSFMYFFSKALQNGRPEEVKKPPIHLDFY